MTSVCSELNLSQQWVLAPAKAKGILSCAKREGIALLQSALVKQLLVYSVQARLQDKLEWVHWREQTCLGCGSTCPERRGWGRCDCAAWSRDGFGGTWQQPCNTCVGVTENMGPGSLLKSLVSGKTSQYAKEQVAQWDSVIPFLADFTDPPGQRPQKPSPTLV